MVDQCPFTLSGADFYALSSDALLTAISERIEQLEKGLNPKDQVEVCQRHFEAALKKLSPSISEQELCYYKQIQSSFSDKRT